MFSKSVKPKTLPCERVDHVCDLPACLHGRRTLLLLIFFCNLNLLDLQEALGDLKVEGLEAHLCRANMDTVSFNSVVDDTS